MATTTGAGLEAQFGFVAEVTYNTFVAPTRFMEFVSESLKFNIERVQSMGIRPGRRLQHRWKAGKQSVTGDVLIELAPQDVGLLLKHVFGDPVTTGSDPYTHTYTGFKAIDDRSLTVQIGKPSEDGTLRSFSYTGMKIATVKMEAAVSQFVRTTFGFYGAKEDTSQTLATPSYDAEMNPFVFTEANLSIAGTVIPVASFDLTIDMKLALDRHRIQAINPGTPKKALVNGIADVTGTITADFTDLTAYNRYVSGTEAALVITCDNGVDSKFVVTMNVRFDGETPHVGGPELLTQPLPFAVTSATSDAAAFVAVLTNSDTTP